MAVIRRIEAGSMHLVETANLTPMAFPQWADRLSATPPAGDAASRLEAMLESLYRAVAKEMILP